LAAQRIPRRRRRSAADTVDEKSEADDN